MPKTQFKEVFDVTAGDFVAAGEVSATIKSRLKSIGINQALIRRVSIAAYEAEMNMIIHSLGGTMTFLMEPDVIGVYCDDVGPGIEDIDLAMTEGYSTAPEHIRVMGFGAGMGLPNISRNCDEFEIESDPSGTHMGMRFMIS
jgi:serine/threonine-protein kinase RsbT